MLFNPRYGATGMIAFPFYLFGELLAPVVEVLGWAALAVGLLLGALDLEFATLFLAVAYGYGVLLSVIAIVFEELSFRRYVSVADVGRLVLFALAEPLGYRQFTVIHRLRAFWRFVRGDEEWGAMQREGFTAASDVRSAA
jgi:hypothetical protein